MRSDTTSWWRREDWDIITGRKSNVCKNLEYRAKCHDIIFSPYCPSKKCRIIIPAIGSRNSFVQWIMVVERNMMEKVDDILWREGVYLKRKIISQDNCKYQRLLSQPPGSRWM